jgi:CBS domain-containing protein
VPDDCFFSTAPFDELSATEQALVRESAVHVHLGAGESLLTPEATPQHLWLLTAGHVEQEENARTLVLGAGATLGWRALLTERCQATAKALDAVQAWRLPRVTVLALLAANARFSARVFAGMSRQLVDEEDVNQNRELLSLMLVRVGDIPLHPPFYVEGALDMVAVCKLMSEHKRTSALVRDVEAGVPRLGFFTTTDLRDAMLRPQPLAVREVAHFALITLPPEAELFDALLTMLRHRVHRIVVKQGDEILGILSQLDLMGFVSNHSHLIALQVDQAASAEDLKLAARQVDDSIALLVRGGVRIDIVSRLVSGLNAQIFARLWSLVAPPELVQNSCLLVMGSEGRGEQILKTDQDNALLLRDGYHCEGLSEIVQRFSTALLSFGYPPCPGNIMLTNPLWCQPLSSFKETIGRWLSGKDPEGAMNLAIFIDAHPVSGDAALLVAAREHALSLATQSDVFIARLAGAVNQFKPPSRWRARLTELRGGAAQTFDLKKLGTFPIVHGVRALALEHRLDALNTADRLRALARQNVLLPALARDLAETLHLMMTFKLRENLRQIAIGQPVSNLVELASLSTLDRNLLQDSLAIIERFRLHLQLHFRLEALGA